MQLAHPSWPGYLGLQLWQLAYAYAYAYSGAGCSAHVSRRDRPTASCSGGSAADQRSWMYQSRHDSGEQLLKARHWLHHAVHVYGTLQVTCTSSGHVHERFTKVVKTGPVPPKNACKFCVGPLQSESLRRVNMTGQGQQPHLRQFVMRNRRERRGGHMHACRQPCALAAQWS